MLDEQRRFREFLRTGRQQPVDSNGGYLIPHYTYALRSGVFARFARAMFRLTGSWAWFERGHSAIDLWKESEEARATIQLLS